MDVSPQLVERRTVLAAEHRATPLRAAIGMESQRHDGGGSGTFVGSMTVHPDEPVLAGHFPGFPIFPGVCLVECAHQSARQALAGVAPRPPRLVAIEKVRFLAPVFPGDRVIVQLTYRQDGVSWVCSATVLTQRGGGGNAEPAGEQAEAALIRLRYGVGGKLISPADPDMVSAGDQPYADVNRIKRLLPHRYPMLLVDQVDTVDASGTVVATKTVTVNEPCYAGLGGSGDHSYPAVLLAESWCQAAGILVVREHPNPDVLTGRVTLFGAISGMRLGRPVQPGAVLRHHVRALKILSDAAVLEGETLAGGEPVMTVDQIVIALRPMAEVGGAA